MGSATLRIILIALLLVAALNLQAQQALTLPSGAIVTATVTPSTTILHLARRRIALRRDDTVARSSSPTLKLIAEVPGKVLLLTDTYPSRPASLSRCGAGEEQFLRLITLRPVPKETFHIKVGSCRDTLELADEGLEWSASTQTLNIHWLTPPADQSNPLTLHIGQKGRIVTNP